jgi:PEP-CTERM motif
MKTTLGTIASTTCCVAVLALTVSTAQAQNLLVDPSFESGVFAQPNPILVPGGVGGGWAQFGATITTAAAYDGTHSAQINANTWNPQGLYQVLPATPGWIYDLKGAYMSPNPALAGYATPALMQISFLDSTGAGIAGANAGNWQPLGAAGQWVISPDVIAHAPAGTAYVGAYAMMMNNSATSGFGFYVDDMIMTATIPEPTILTLLGLGLAGALIWRRRQ